MRSATGRRPRSSRKFKHRVPRVIQKFPSRPRGIGWTDWQRQGMRKPWRGDGYGLRQACALSASGPGKAWPPPILPARQRLALSRGFKKRAAFVSCITNKRFAWRFGTSLVTSWRRFRPGRSVARWMPPTKNIASASARMSWGVRVCWYVPAQPCESRCWWRSSAGGRYFPPTHL